MNRQEDLQNETDPLQATIDQDVICAFCGKKAIWYLQPKRVACHLHLSDCCRLVEAEEHVSEFNVRRLAWDEWET